MSVKALRSRHGAATLDELESLYRREGAAFERVAIAIVGDEALGCDAVHDGFVLAVRNRHRFRGDAPLDAWVWRIVLNEARKRRAREAPFVATDPALLEYAAPAASNGSGDASRIRLLLSPLPERQRLALFLRYYADLDYASIARALGVKPGTVAATLNAAHEKLREQLLEVHEWQL
jgi:RNA polymerase sigma-70 factor (ECF subfamily)